MLRLAAVAAALAFIVAAPAFAQCTVTVTGGSGPAPWTTCPTWSGPTWNSTAPVDGHGNQEEAPSLGTADFNGDGLLDLVYQGGLRTPAFGFATSSGSSFAGGTAESVATSNACYTGNFDGSGRDGIVCFVGTDNSNTLSYYASTGTGFSAPVNQTLNGLFGANMVAPYVGSANPCFVMDVDGDGTDDIVCGYPVSILAPPNGRTELVPSTSWGVYQWVNGSFKYTVWNGPSGGFTQTSGCIVGDFNGDGLQDLACLWSTYHGPNWVILLSTGTNWSPQIWSGPATTYTTNCANVYGDPGVCGNQCVVGDFDGDGVDDIACPNLNGTTNTFSIGFGGGTNGFKSVSSWTVSISGVSTGCTNNLYCGCVAEDMFGTGRTGLLCATTTGNTSTGWAYLASSGTGFTPTTFSVGWSLLQGGILPASVQQLCVYADFNGDGILDVACNPNANGSWLMGLSSRPQ